MSITEKKDVRNFVKIILDTDKKTITVSYNYTDKLAEINRIAQEYGGTNV